MPTTRLDCAAVLSRVTALLALSALAIAPAACGPGRTTFAQYPGAPASFNRAGSDAKAVTIADQVLAAAGGQASWDKARQIRWTETVQQPGAPAVSGEEAWDRWNGRHYGRLHVGAGDVVVMREIYTGKGAAFMEHGQSQDRMPEAEGKKAIAQAAKFWAFDTALLCMPFLMEQPGTTLTLVGPANDDAGQPTLDDVKVVFDAKDADRAGTSYHVIVNRQSHLIERIEAVKAGAPDTQRIGYKLGGWTDVGGLKFATTFENLGMKGAMVKFSDIQVSSEPDESLYVPQVK